MHFCYLLDFKTMPKDKALRLDFGMLKPGCWIVIESVGMLVSYFSSLCHVSAQANIPTIDLLTIISNELVGPQLP